jgi:hypothetical protein
MAQGLMPDYDTIKKYMIRSFVPADRYLWEWRPVVLWRHSRISSSVRITELPPAALPPPTPSICGLYLLLLLQKQHHLKELTGLYGGASANLPERANRHQ